ncbi:uncharacterized protein B0H18DRAFT_1021886 [Fomitopsis serialis]|uniref:uncharacterized protein n=1 Tax=Fomitopsis serialis TaxID=139415 RepID=UPI0020083E2A|nr:uncharacterized protein B0H18DRAFT_1021886 [Neoantrodia serialis]KAH9921101.1 hypothetical protein B0H18DRAFT_1021886 [Neoantrodia serialis]
MDKISTTACRVTPPQPRSPQSASPLQPLDVSHTLPIPKGVKVFVNIAYDPNRAMLGEDVLDADNAQGWFVPVVVSEPRQDTDKAGKPSVVFDCIYHSSLKPRALKDQPSRPFSSRIEASRVPLSPGHPALASAPRAPTKKLVEELAGAQRQQTQGDTQEGSGDVQDAGTASALSWSKNALTEGLQIFLAVPILRLSTTSAEQALVLKRQRDLDWRVAEGRLIVHV